MLFVVKHTAYGNDCTIFCSPRSHPLSTMYTFVVIGPILHPHIAIDNLISDVLPFKQMALAMSFRCDYLTYIHTMTFSIRVFFYAETMSFVEVNSVQFKKKNHHAAVHFESIFNRILSTRTLFISLISHRIIIIISIEFVSRFGQFLIFR